MNPGLRPWHRTLNGQQLMSVDIDKRFVYKLSEIGDPYQFLKYV